MSETQGRERAEQDLRDDKRADGDAAVGTATVDTDQGPETLPAQPPAPPRWGRDPAIMMSKKPEGGWIGVMHLGEKVRAFMGESIERMHTQINKMAIGEFHLSQAEADDLVSRTAAAQDEQLQPSVAPRDAPAAASQQDVDAVQQEMSVLRDENEKLRDMIAQQNQQIEDLQEQLTSPQSGDGDSHSSTDDAKRPQRDA